MIGRIPSVFDFFQPKNGNPYVLAFHASALLEMLLAANWIIFRGGAEMLVKHPGILNGDFRSPRTVKLLAAAFLASGLTAETIMFLNLIPLPSH